jgi:hypothetical protein
LALALWACGAPANDGSGARVEQRQFDLEPSDPIGVRIISIAHSASQRMSEADANVAIDIINRAGADVGGLNFELVRYEVLPISKDGKNDVLTWADLAPIWQSMGISSVGADAMERHMASWSANQRFLHRWLNQYRKYMMPNQVVGWQGTDGGVEQDTSAFFSGRGNFAHEMGHGFNLSHSFELLSSEHLQHPCDSWDLLYGMRGRGLSNVYFASRAQCEDFAASHASSSFNLIDGRNEDKHNGRQRHMDGGVITVQHPRCSSCGTDLGFDQPVDDGVERYSTGDWQIAGYAKYMDGVPAVNAMSYCSYWNDDHTRLTGCPDGSQVGTSFYSASQADVMRAWAEEQRPWVFDSRHPVETAAPSSSCAYLRAGEGLGHDQPHYSCDGRFRLYLQADANLVLSQKGSGGDYNILLWNTGPLVDGTDTTGIKLVMQGDGNFVVYDGSRSPLWHTGTYGHPGAYVKISDNGDMKVRTPDGSSFYWSTGTHAH